MNPKDLLQRWVEVFNTADAHAMAEFYHNDAVVHQVANEPVISKAAILQMFIDEFELTNMVCIPENFFEDGEWAMLEWKDPMGLRGSGFFHIVDGKIKHQRGYWDKLSFLRAHKLPIPSE